MENLKNKEIEIEVIKVVNLGYGMGKFNEKIIFIDGGLPGEKLIVKINKDNNKNYCFGEIKEILYPSKFRQNANCEMVNLGGGCCTFSHIRDDYQSEIKENIVNNEFARKLEWHSKIDLKKFENSNNHWRTRVRFQTDKDGKLGSFKHKSNQLITEKLNCIQQKNTLNRDLTELRFKPRSMVKVVIDDAGERFIITSKQKNNFSAIKKISDRNIIVDPFDFWQPHYLADSMYEKHFEKLLSKIENKDKIKVAWDLYCGNGNFSYLLYKNLPKINKIFGIEYSKNAIMRAKNNFKDIDSIKFISSKVESISKNIDAPNLVVLDPPRSGLSKEAFEKIISTKSANIIYFGCDLAVFIRDIIKFKKLKYKVDDLQTFDAFPTTFHTESVALLKLVK